MEEQPARSSAFAEMSARPTILLVFIVCFCVGRFVADEPRFFLNGSWLLDQESLRLGRSDGNEITRIEIRYVDSLANFEGSGVALRNFQSDLVRNRVDIGDLGDKIGGQDHGIAGASGGRSFNAVGEIGVQ